MYSLWLICNGGWSSLLSDGQWFPVWSCACAAIGFHLRLLVSCSPSFENMKNRLFIAKLLVFSSITSPCLWHQWLILISLVLQCIDNKTSLQLHYSNIYYLKVNFSSCKQTLLSDELFLKKVWGVGKIYMTYVVFLCKKLNLLVHIVSQRKGLYGESNKLEDFIKMELKHCRLTYTHI